MYNNYGKSQKQYGFAQQGKTPAEGKERFIEHPETKTTIRRSKDGKWIIFKVTTTHFKPASFLESPLGEEA